MEDAKKTYSTAGFTIPFGDCAIPVPVTVSDSVIKKAKKDLKDFLDSWYYANLMTNKVQKYRTLEMATKINHIMKNGDYTTVLWADGTKTIVKKATDEKDDPEMALAYALLKKIKGNNASEVRRYFEEAEKKTIVKEKKKK